MTFPRTLRIACLLAPLCFTSHAQAELFASSASSASSAGSASSGSVSDSLSGSSDSGKGDEKKANGDYEITDVAQAPGRAGVLRVTMQAEESQEHIVLNLPASVFEKQRLGRGDVVRAERRVYGYEFARADTSEAFFLVLTDDWHGELAPRPVASL
ncbi:hypothetical protein AVKW3434_22030 [Acidovorax sp. SUPP3434]|uniref:hypothetical protein n=1 Tax=Acidovorax sp. SUPP3434 TaxID=2920880 RepID=UPI0023DE4B88|nr:hypothetical protein [Acidovorax sp. SUPP3434]GKT02117.1 hypothetical protein AVKW3434_22030 [Acidovorax sp. SUPP3434]